MKSCQPRGLRNNNLLNIRLGERWQGLRRSQTDKEFCQFVNPAFGFRAAFKIINTYYLKYNLRTLRQLINRWAPPTENNCHMYIESVKARMAIMYKPIDEEQKLPAPASDKLLWCNIVRAMVFVECGVVAWKDPITWTQINHGYNLAFKQQ